MESEEKRPAVEGMSEFFTARVDGYEEHMLESWKDVYALFAGLLPDAANDILDLGCGTGLELDGIFALRPKIRVTGVDMTKAMLDRLREKHADKALKLIEGDYFQVDFGAEAFDAAISFETLHHFSFEKKRPLYRRIWEALRPGGQYIECDYMCETIEEERLYFAERERLRLEEGLPEDAFVHYDTPLTVDRQKELFRLAGFSSVREVYSEGGTVILIGEKQAR